MEKCRDTKTLIVVFHTNISNVLMIVRIIIIHKRIVKHNHEVINYQEHCYIHKKSKHIHENVIMQRNIFRGFIYLDVRAAMLLTTKNIH